MEIFDFAQGAFQLATLQFILAPVKWDLKDNLLTSDTVTIKIKSETNLDIKLLKKDESLCYMEKTTVPLLQVNFSDNAKIFSIVIFE